MAAEADPPPHDAASSPSGLLATKLHLPRPRPGFVPRPRLLSRLDEGLARELTLVCAPAGSGKTSLLADWCQRRHEPVGWLCLDPGDNDPTRFWRHVAAALDRVRAGVAERVAALLGPPAPRDFTGVVTVIANALLAEPGQVVLVLDDYHLIDAEPVHGSLLFLLEHAPPDLRVVLASRAAPRLSLARLRARGQLHELGADDLRFVPEEAAALLRETVGHDLGDDAAAVLAARTEGWAAGLQLAALSLRGDADVDAFVASFSGSQRYVVDYLTEEVLERQPESVRTFLLETSVLERLNGPLCDTVTGGRDSQRMLEAIERANLFLVPMDDRRGWWRYHHLFADLLRSRLRSQQPERTRDLHGRAAAWHEAHGMPDDAVRHALAAGDVAWAARLVERFFDEMFLSSEGATLQRWLEALPPDLLATRPRLLVATAALHIVGGLVDEIEPPLDAAERVLASTGEEPFQPSVGRPASRLANLPAVIALGRAYAAQFRGDGEATGELAAKAVAALDDGEWMLDGLARFNLAVSAWLRGRVDEAAQAMAANIARWRAAGHRDLTAVMSSHLGRIQCAQGRPDAALATYRRALEVAAPPGQSPLPAAGVASVGIAEVAYDRDELDRARHHAVDGIARCRQFVYAEFLARGLVVLAWIRHATGDAAGARQAMEEAAETTDPALTDLHNPVAAQRARLWLVQGDVAAASRWAADRGLRPDAEPRYPREGELLVLARVLLAEDRPDQAQALLDRLHAAASSQGRTGSVVAIAALRALASAARGEEDAALALLSDALSLASPRGSVRVFVDEGQPMGALVGQVIASRRVEATVPMRYLGRLTRAFERQTRGEGPGHAQGVVTGLSDREREVLALVAAGKQNQEIARELFLALNTVKKHVTHVLDKLGAANRTEATTRARALGLLE